ncbi:conserved hypothetical protein [Candidatus Glomeribacter gigasporarum BEG34]|uniref:PIN domain-containing protein n=1 Tax=Candidatus Glomeribacter gigasporarum BEG34 TaxID=1070319 RepID=G2JBM6_9BURK|nr:type II toxin-antitoxin system VapC family toxin [Candidatus Glomeribacter gigasporarum]CCD30180.1 conserved hypothetical protein [Candidatus Glomeribacter gigasporarum BEG34]
MIAIDTNVLLRYLLQDDKRQSAQATTLLKAGRKVLITDVVLAESVWTLKGKKYQLSKEKIIDIVHALFSEPAITFEDNQAVWCALKDYANAKPIRSSGKIKQADFPDALIVNKAKRFGHVKGIEIESVYTFDQAALCFDGTEELQ